MGRVPLSLSSTSNDENIHPDLDQEYPRLPHGESVFRDVDVDAVRKAGPHLKWIQGRVRVPPHKELYEVG